MDIPSNAQRCGNCYGVGGMWITPGCVSPPSLHRGDDGGYEPHSNIKKKIYVSCDGCKGKGYLENRHTTQNT